MAQIIIEATMTGVKMFDGTVEGQHYSNTTVFCLLDLDDSKGTAVGQAAGSYKAEGTALFQKLKGLAFPVNVQLLVKETTNGKDQTKKVLMDVRLPAPQQSAQSQVKAS